MYRLNINIRKITSAIFILLTIIILSVVSITCVGITSNKFVRAQEDKTPYFSFWTEVLGLQKFSVQPKVNNFSQQKNYTCGAAAVRFLLFSYGLNLSEEELTKIIGTDQSGSTLEGMATAVAKFGLEGVGLQTDYAYIEKARKPIIAFINNNHYVVVRKTTPGYITIFDPSPNYGLLKVTSEEFCASWNGVIFTVKTRSIPSNLGK